MKLKEEQIEKIADELQTGMKVYVNIETTEIKSIIDFDSYIDAEEEPWEEDIKEIEKNYDKYLEFEKMDSSESYRVMEDFTEMVEDEELRKRLELGLSLSKPFRNFKDIIDYEDENRKKWFAYKNARYIEYVKELLEMYNNRIDDEE